MRPSVVSALLAGLAVSFLQFAAPPSAGATESIGSVKTVRGSASVVRAGETIPAQTGLKLLEGDILETGPDGALGLMLRDESSLSLGPSSRIAIERFLFTPAEGKLGLTTRVFRGTLAYLSGLIGKLAPESARFETPVASIGIRGTRFGVKVNE